MADATETTAVGCIEKLKSYVRTHKGTILTAEIVLSFIVMICYAASRFGGYSAVAICEMIFAIIIMIVFVMEFDKQFTVISWPWTDLLRAAIGCVLYLITSLICVIRGAGDGALIAGGVLGLLAGVLFGYDAYFTFKTIKANRQHTPAPTDYS